MEAERRDMVGLAAKGHIPQAAMSVEEVSGIDHRDHSHRLGRKGENQQGCPASVFCVKERGDLLFRDCNSPDFH